MQSASGTKARIKVRLGESFLPLRDVWGALQLLFSRLMRLTSEQCRATYIYAQPTPWVTRGGMTGAEQAPCIRADPHNGAYVFCNLPNDGVTCRLQPHQLGLNTVKAIFGNPFSHAK